MPPAHQIVTLKVELAHTHIPIWRRLDVNADTTLRQLHHILQIAMGWENEHLYGFQCGDEIYDDSHTRGDMGLFAQPQGDDRKITVGEIAAKRKSFVYHYDFGDSWTHKIKIERSRMADSPLDHAVLRGGESACPPEDCGGPPGYAKLLHILTHSTDPDEHEWFESIADYHGPFDPRNLDERAVNAALARMAVRGKGQRMSETKEPRLYHVRVELLDLTPVISRALMVESDLSLFDFHEVLQIAFGWTSMHAHRFAWDEPSQGATAGVAGLGPMPIEESTPLHAVADSHATFCYEYLPAGDVGDNYRWRHRITVIGSEPGELMLGGAVVFGGTMNGPAEHCKGPAHYKELLIDFVEGNASKCKAAATELFRHGLFNPAYYDERGINMELQRLASAA